MGTSAPRKGSTREQWRDRIRSKARGDKLRVATFRHGDRAIATRQRPVSGAELRCELDRMTLLTQLAEAARELGHEPSSWVRHDQQSIALCLRCDARIYARTGAMALSDGEGISQPCPMQLVTST